MVNNKKAQGDVHPIGFVVGIILALILLGIGIVLLLKYMNLDDKKDCVQVFKGECTADVVFCKQGYRLETRGKCPDKALPTCCAPINPPKIEADPRCKSVGQTCGSALNLCDADYQCVTKCEYCHKYPTANECKSAGVDFTKEFACTCTTTECNDKKGEGKCVLNFCPSSDGDKQCCIS